MLTCILLAVASTFMFSTSTVLQHHSTTSEGGGAGSGGVGSMLAQMASNRWYLLSLVTNGLGLALQVAALKVGAIFIVQPVLTLALVFSLAMNHLVSRTRLTVGEAVASFLLVGGLVLFLWLAGATHPHGEDATGRRGPTVALAVCMVLGIGACVLVARRARPAVRAASLGLAVAAIFACNAALITTCTRIAAHPQRGFVDLLVSWQLWLLVVAGLTGMVLNQMAFAAGPLAMSLPVIASADPLLSLVVARVVYGERLRHAPLELAGEVLGLAVLLVSVFYLSRQSAAASDAAAA